MKGKARVETVYHVQFLGTLGMRGVWIPCGPILTSKRVATRVCRARGAHEPVREWRVVRSRTERDVVLEISRKAPK